VHLVPRGTVELFGPNGNLISRGVINQNSGFILPESFRQFDVNFANQNQPWLPGKYKLVTSWRFDGREEMTTETITYWYVGKLFLWLMLVLCLVIVCILFIKWRNKPFFRGQ
jgi:hypothetical protein